MLNAFAAFLFRIAGWKIIGRPPHEIKKAVWVGAPHSSNWDFMLCLGGRGQMKINIGFLAKSQLFKWYSGWLFRSLGCYPVYRNKSGNLVESVARMFDQNQTLHIAITPEGTRKDVERLKTGFYHIALQAKVPMILIGFDYPRKALVISEPLYLSGDAEKDLKPVYDFYLNIQGRRKTWLQAYADNGIIPDLQKS
jgi:1-acyl-sn-glycerol-3-phosphate acyltransferase